MVEMPSYRTSQIIDGTPLTPGDTEYRGNDERNPRELTRRTPRPATEDHHASDDERPDVDSTAMPRAKDGPPSSRRLGTRYLHRESLYVPEVKTGPRETAKTQRFGLEF